MARRRTTTSPFRSTLRASVTAILGAEAPPVVLQGSRFFNEDRWTGRQLVVAMCAWARQNPGCQPTLEDVTGWVDTVNATKPPRRRIVLASLPRQVPRSMEMALVGGGYHEAFHTRYSRRTNLTVEEVAEIVLPRWARVPNWGPLTTALLDWGNTVEDVRIERLGNAEYPGVRARLEDLQDLILTQESTSNPVAARSHSDNAPELSIDVVMATFRDLGLGYDTTKQAEALASYKQTDPEAFASVTEGPLNPMLREAIALTEDDTLGFLRVTMDILGHLTHEADPEELEQAQQDAQDVLPACPICGSTQIVLRPTSTGGAVVTCLSCGWQEEMPVTAAVGHFWGPDPAPSEPRLLDGNAALQAAVQSALEAADAGCAEDERPWRPFTLDFDRVEVVQPSTAGRDADRQHAAAMLAEVRAECAVLRARLQRVAIASRQRGVHHGVARGDGLSERMLGDTVADLRAGRRPDRAFFSTAGVPATDLAVAIVLDESESMAWTPPGERSKLEGATRALLALCYPLAGLGHPVLAVGFRDGPRCSDVPTDTGHHRVHGVVVDVFKDFEERMQATLWRFANTRAVGGTPMADGVQHALDALHGRTETHRVLFVITDGDPNHGHLPVLRQQQRLAREAGIHVVGVGIGSSCANVMKVFADSVWVSDVHDLPKPLVAKLNSLVDGHVGAHRP